MCESGGLASPFLAPEKNVLSGGSDHILRISDSAIFITEYILGPFISPMPPHAIYRFGSTSKAHLIPVEILSEIFLLIAKDSTWVRKNLMLVCRRWHAIMLSTPGISSDLLIWRSTTIEVVWAAIQRRRWLLNVIVNPNNKRIPGDWNADEFHACFTTAIEAASRWRSLEFRSFPPPGEYRGLHIIPPLEKLESFISPQGCDLGDFLEPLMTAVTTTTTHLTQIRLGNVDAVHYLMQPACLHVFSSLRNLDIWLSQRMETPVNILPYLQGLESFTARHLHLPIYPPDTSLPLVQTLLALRLKSVSVQWMAGRIFPTLLVCIVEFPHYASTLTLQPVTMPSCQVLEYKSNDLSPLRSFRHPPLDDLQVICGQWNISRGNQQLVVLYPILAASAQQLTSLVLEVRCSENLLLHVLSLVPVLVVLFLRLASPNALSEAFFRAFVVTNVDEGSPYASQAITPKLKRLDMHYRRWLRAPERKALIPVFGDIVSSRFPESELCFLISFDELEGYWCVERPVDSIHRHSPFSEITGGAVGVLGPHGMVFITAIGKSMFLDVPFEEAECLMVLHQLSIACLPNLHCLVELRVADSQKILPTAPPHNLPLFHTLRVLEVYNIHQSFFTGQTFHRLEKCKILSSQEGHSLVFGLPTEMPVCTRLDAEDLTLLATLKLPQICELGVSFDHPESNLIWGKYISVNANLSGLELLHVHHWGVSTDLVQILRFLPVLEKLSVGNGKDLAVSFFRAFIPVGENRVSGLKNGSCDEGRIPPMPCPMLKGLFIEGVDPIVQPGLLVLNEVVTLRAVGGSPLQTFTFSQFQPEYGTEFKLIRKDGSFGMEIVPLPMDARPFELLI